MALLHLVLCLAVCVSFGSVPSEALDCFECNLHLCSRNESSLPESQRHESEECKKFHEAMALTNQTARTHALDELDQDYSTCEPVLKGNCLACLKVDTTASFIGVRGVQYQSQVVSKVCAQAKPELMEDNCDYRGPKYARSIVCVCYGDNCNAGTPLTASVTALLTLILSKLL